MMLSASVVLAALWGAGASDAGPERPRVYFSDYTSGQPRAKDPAVVRFAGKYWLYYSHLSYPGKKWLSIGIATSDNLLDWERVGELTKEGEAEANGFGAPGAMVRDGKIHLFYQSYGNGPRDAICHAWSEDGIHFTRNPTNPIFRPTGDWTSGRAIDADVIEHEGRLLLYWATRDPDMKIQSQGVAAAPIDSDYSAEHWVQLNMDAPILAPRAPTPLDPPDFDLAWEGECIEAAAMCRHNGRLYMFYGGNYNCRPQQIGVAVSDDGVNFRRLSDRPFLANGKPGEWNESESGHPFVFTDDDGRHYLFYQGSSDGGKTWFLSMRPIFWDGDTPRLGDWPKE